MTARILIIEDDEAILNILRRGLSYDGYEVDVAKDGQSGLLLAHDSPPDIVVLDWMLPGMDGIEVCKRLRKGANIPIIMLTARDTLTDRIDGLDAGADDYLVKPFELDELMARIRALLRRTHTNRPEVYEFEELKLDTGTRRALLGERVIDLTAKEYELLELFMRYPKQVLSRDRIYDEVWGYDFGGESNIIEVYVRYLRQKLEVDGNVRLIHTVRGMGYALRKEE